MAEPCGVLDLGCKAGEIAQSAVGDAIENMANAVMEAFGKAVASVGTVWVNVGTPNLTGGTSSSSASAGSTAPRAENVTTVLGYVTWLGFAVAVLSLFWLGALIATRMRAGEGVAAIGRLGVILGAVVFMSAGSSIVAAAIPSGPSGAGGAVLFLQSSLWWYMGAAAVVSVIIGSARMAWEQRAEPGREVVKSLLTLIVVAGAGVTVVGLLVSAADSFSVWVINNSLNCDVTAKGSACFGENVLTMLALTTNPAAGSLGSLLIIVLGGVAMFGAIFQILLMLARGGMLVILTGILPLSASFTNTEMGQSWFKKTIGWLVAFILYKPAAAIVYAAAFQLVGTDTAIDDGSGLVAVLAGVLMMLIALFALPALMRFVTPLVAATAGGGAGGAMAIGAMAALPTGAAAVGRLASGAGRGSPGGSGAGSSSTPGGPSGSSGSQGGSGKQGASGSGQPTPGGGSATGGAAKPMPAGAGPIPAGGGGGGAAAGAGAAGGGAAAAAGPAGAAAGAALNGVQQAGAAASGAARSLGESSTGEGGGADGSR